MGEPFRHLRLATDARIRRLLGFITPNLPEIGNPSLNRKSRSAPEGTADLGTKRGLRPPLNPIWHPHGYPSTSTCLPISRLPFFFKNSRSVQTGHRAASPTVTPDSTTLHPLLLQPSFWRRRLEALARTPRQLLVFPRADLAWPGIRASEIWLRAHDGIRLRALVGYSELPVVRPHLRLAMVKPSGGQQPFDWDQVRDGGVQANFLLPTERRLEDRVLDLVRVAGAARDLSGLDTPRTVLEADPFDAERDEVRIARQLFDEGWAQG